MNLMESFHALRHRPLWRWLLALLVVALLAIPAWVYGKLPDPTPEQAKAAADKKAATEAQAEKDKASLSSSMDEVSQRWRKNAADKGWTVHPPTAVKAPPSASGSLPTQPAPPPDPKSEKLGTAPPSADVKKPENQRPK